MLLKEAQYPVPVAVASTLNRASPSRRPAASKCWKDTLNRS